MDTTEIQFNTQHCLLFVIAFLVDNRIEFTIKYLISGKTLLTIGDPKAALQAVNLLSDHWKNKHEYFVRI